MKVYEEIDIPPSSLYKAVGFNDMHRVKVIMEGDDKDKRSDAKKASRVNSGVGSPGRQSPAKEENAVIKRQSTMLRMDMKMNEFELKEEESRKIKVTNLHYRKFYEDELENDKGLFPDPDDPFIKVPIKRGQSRGLTKSWFSFLSADKVDESGEVTNEKIVGYFKGRVKVRNTEEEKAHSDAMEAKMADIFDLIRQIH